MTGDTPDGLSDPLCYLDGELVPLSAARIHPFDRGFVFGDGLYEVFRVRAGRPLWVAEHLDRLESGLAEVRIPLPGGRNEIERAVTEVTARAGLGDGSVYLQITRGAGPRARTPPPDLEPTVLVAPSAHPHLPPAAVPHAAVTVTDRRWGRCDLKTVSLMATVLGKLAARDAGADEVVFATPDGSLREGGSTNLFVRRDDALETHPAGPEILPGITRALLLDLARREGLPLRPAAPRLEQRELWQEAFLCGTLTGVQPLVELDGEPVADGRSGEWTRRLAGALEALERQLCGLG